MRRGERVGKPPAAAGVTEISDADYRCAWRPCDALEEPVEVPPPNELLAALAPEQPPRDGARQPWRRRRRRRTVTPPACWRSSASA